MEVTGKSREIVLRQVRQLMEYWAITPEELERAGRRRRTPAAAAPTPPSGGIKYRHPVTGETWDGVGAQPDWLRTALLKQGYTVAELRPVADQGPA